jgi:hypothetical protein
MLKREEKKTSGGKLKHEKERYCIQRTNQIWIEFIKVIKYTTKFRIKCDSE